MIVFELIGISEERKCSKHVVEIVFLAPEFLPQQSWGLLGLPNTTVFNTQNMQLCTYMELCDFRPCFLSWKCCGTRVTLSTDQRKQLLNDNEKLLFFDIRPLYCRLLWLPYWCKKIYESLRPLPLNDLAVFDSVDQSFIMFTYLSWISTPIIYMLLDR